MMDRLQRLQHALGASILGVSAGGLAAHTLGSPWTDTAQSIAAAAAGFAAWIWLRPKRRKA